MKPGGEYDLTYISLGAGVQSTALYIMSAKGLHGVPRADVAIFADTQSEASWTYDVLDELERRDYGIPIYRVTYGNLGKDIIDRHNGKRSRFAAIPLFTAGPDGKGAMLRRQCTREYKITPIERKVRELMGYKKGQRIKGTARALIGISLDEVIRMRPSRTRWIENCYPLVDGKIRRAGCLAFLEEQGFPRPGRSACVFCPYHDNGYWLTLQREHPDEFARAVSFDRAFRDMSASGIERPVYLHRTLQPLDQVDFRKAPGQMDLFGEECEGVCGI